MTLSAAGHPLHTRSLSVTLRHGEDGVADFSAYILDLRKRGFAPVGGDLQGTGIIHHMRLDGRIDRAQGRLTGLTADMPSVAFEASPSTGGESCRDQIGRVAQLEGLTLDQTWARAIAAAIGGPRGCSHILTLAQLLAPSAVWGFAEDARLHGAAAPRRRGERLFRRDVTVDGYESAPGTLALTLQLNDLHFAPAPARPAPMDRFAAQREITVSASVALPELSLAALAVHERVRSRADFATAAWEARSLDVADLVGTSLRAGISARILTRFAAAGADAPLREALLQLAPALIQCFAALDIWGDLFRGGGAAAQTGGQPDSCWMWRTGGGLRDPRAGS